MMSRSFCQVHLLGGGRQTDRDLVHFPHPLPKDQTFIKHFQTNKLLVLFNNIEIFSLYTRNVWETICDAVANFGLENFLLILPRIPYSWPFFNG